MEPEVSLLFSQELATGPYREPDKSSLHPHSISFTSDFILFSHLNLGLPGSPFPSGSTRTLYTLHFSLMLHALPISYLNPLKSSAPCSQTHSVYVLPLIISNVTKICLQIYKSSKKKKSVGWVNCCWLPPAIIRGFRSCGDHDHVFLPRNSESWQLTGRTNMWS
jgi:hypothetical protein